MISCNRKPLDIDIPSDPETPAFSVAAEVSSDIKDQASSVIFYLEEGDRNASYTVQISLDGKNLFKEAQTLDFRSDPIKKIFLPAVRPGRRQGTALVSDGNSSVSLPLTFNEPVRFSKLELSLAYNSKTGNHELTVGNNPYGILIHAESELTITGTATYFAGNSSGWTYDEPWTFRTTDTKTISSDATVDCNKAGVFCLAERDKTAKEMTSQYVFSAIWRGAGGSEDWYYSLTGYQPVYYSISKEEFSVSFDIESIPGVETVLRNDIQGCTVSGL